MISYTPERVASILSSAEEAVKYADKHGLRYVEQSPIIVRNVCVDLLEAHKALEMASQHMCKSKFIPGVIVGAGLTVGLGIVMSKRDARKKNTP